MANPQHIQWLNEGVEAWNRRREANRFTPDLSGASLVPAGLLRGPPPWQGTQFWSEIFLGDELPEDWAGTRLPGINLAGADLSHAQMNFVDFTGANLSSANLDYADLNMAFLCRANLRLSKMSNASLRQANLLGAELVGARLIDSNLQACNLNDANLSHSVLTGSRLNNTYTTGTILVDTDLSDVASLPPELWKGRLFSENQSPEQHELEATSVESVEGLLGHIGQIRNFYGDQEEDLLFYFRGERRCGWALRPSALRELGFFQSEGRMLLDLVARRPEDFHGVSSALGQWVVAQHHGLKTRFLDITSNPLVALFHACETGNPDEPEDGRLHVFAIPRSWVKPFNSDSVSVVANFARLTRDTQQEIMPRPLLQEYEGARRRLYGLIRTEKPNFEERIGPKDFYRVIVVEPQQSTERIRAQSGALLVSAFHQRFERDEILKCNTNIPVYAHYELSVPGGCKARIRDTLRLLNITKERLFPGLDASAETITEQIKSTVEGDTAPSAEENWNLMARN